MILEGPIKLVNLQTLSVTEAKKGGSVGNNKKPNTLEVYCALFTDLIIWIPEADRNSIKGFGLLSSSNDKLVVAKLKNLWEEQSSFKGGKLNNTNIMLILIIL